MKLVIAATAEVAIPTIKELQKNHEVKLVTQPDRPAGRGKQIRQSQIAENFRNVFKPETERELVEILDGSDLLITIGYGRILKAETLNVPIYGGINLHFSLLPKWRGAAPVQRSLEAGDKKTGVTVFQMDKGMDTGPIWVQKEFEIPVGYNSTQLFADLAILGVTAVTQALLLIQHGATPKVQSNDFTIAKKISKSECVIDWRMDSETILRKIRAFSINPGVTTQIRGSQIKVNDANFVESSIEMKIGELSDKGVVGCGKGALQLLTITPSGKREMSVTDWLNGFKLKPGERFEETL